MRAIKKMRKMIGTIPRFYDRYVIADMCKVLNSYADAIDYLVETVSNQEQEIKKLKEQVCELEKTIIEPCEVEELKLYLEGKEMLKKVRYGAVE